MLALVVVDGGWCFVVSAWCLAFVLVLSYTSHPPPNMESDVFFPHPSLPGSPPPFCTRLDRPTMKVVLLLTIEG